MSGVLLIADGDEERAKRLAEACADLGIACELATNGPAALERVLSQRPAALVAHVDLPVIPGEQLVDIVEANPRTQGVGLLLIGAARDGTRVNGRVLLATEDSRVVARHAHGLLSDDSLQAMADEEEGGVEGELSQLPLSDLIESFHTSRKTGTIELQLHHDEGPNGMGRVYLRGGDVVQAVVGLVEGEKALFRLLAWERGSFEFTPVPVTIDSRIETPTRALLREGRRQLDEWERTATNLPPLEAHVALRIRTERLPNVIHPLTQEVLVVLELYTRVRDVVDHCSYPDYQVLRTLQTLIARGMLEQRRDSAVSEIPRDARFFSSSHASRLREWLAASQPRGGSASDAKVLVLSPSEGVAAAFLQLLGRVPGLERRVETSPAPDDLVSIGRVPVEGKLGLDFVHLPVADRFAPIWPLAGHGALAVLVPIAAPVDQAADRVRRAAKELRKLPDTRIFYLLLLGPGDRVAPDALRENLSLLDDGPLFLMPHDNGEKSTILLREMFGRVLP
ncbi:MAG: DUF4388 domain-containing protein [Myxococcales bacterium]|nr:DUF4388 domain-containing protein [Myxococcales bacterium]